MTDVKSSSTDGSLHSSHVKTKTCPKIFRDYYGNTHFHLVGCKTVREQQEITITDALRDWYFMPCELCFPKDQELALLCKNAIGNDTVCEELNYEDPDDINDSLLQIALYNLKAIDGSTMTNDVKSVIKILEPHTDPSHLMHLRERHDVLARKFVGMVKSHITEKYGTSVECAHENKSVA